MTVEEATERVEKLQKFLLPHWNDGGESLPKDKEALKMAIAALRVKQDKDFETVDNVRVSKQLATFIKPYSGCPRGSMGPSGGTSAVELLRNAKKYVIAGPDDRFVCIPEWDYESCLKALESRQEAEKDEPLTVNELKNMAGAPVWILLDTGRGYWALVGESLDNLLAFVTIPRDTIFVPDGCYGETWIAYRHPPKGAG